MEQELREGMQAWRKLHPKATLDEIELELDRQSAAVLRVQMVAETVATSKAVKGEGAVTCPVRAGQRWKKAGSTSGS